MLVLCTTGKLNQPLVSLPIYPANKTRAGQKYTPPFGLPFHLNTAVPVSNVEHLEVPSLMCVFLSDQYVLSSRSNKTPPLFFSSLSALFAELLRHRAHQVGHAGQLVPPGGAAAQHGLERRELQGKLTQEPRVSEPPPCPSSWYCRLCCFSSSRWLGL